MANIYYVLQDNSKSLPRRTMNEVMVSEKVSNILISFAKVNTIDKLTDLLSEFNQSMNVIVDSGAFSVFNSGAKININDYAKFIIDVLSNDWEHKFTFINLDVIGDYDKTTSNYNRLRSSNLPVCPVLGMGDDVSKLSEFCNDAPMVFLGGLVKSKNREPWLNSTFSYLLKHYPKSQLPKLHLLGNTNEKMLSKYPAFSCDSCHWVSVFRFGYGSKEARLPSCPRRINDDTIDTLKHIMREHVRHFIKIETTTNKLWKSRGIIYA